MDCGISKEKDYVDYKIGSPTPCFLLNTVSGYICGKLVRKTERGKAYGRWTYVSAVVAEGEGDLEPLSV